MEFLISDGWIGLKLFDGMRDWRSGEWGLLFLLLVSLTIKVTLLSSDDIINLDGTRYLDAARQFAQGNFSEGLSIDWMPFYALLIAGFHFLIQDWVLTGQLISLFSLVFALVPLYLLTRDLFDEKAAFWAGLAFALSPIINDHAVGLLRDPIFLFFVAWSVYFCLRAIRTEKLLFFTLSSLSATFAFFSRLEAILLWAIFLSVLTVLAIKNGAERRFMLKGMTVLVGLPLALGVLLGGGSLLVAGSDLASSGRAVESRGQLKEAVTGNSIAYYQRKVSRGVLENYHSRYEKLKDLENEMSGWKNTGNLLETTRHYLPLIYLISALEAMARNLFPLFLVPLFTGFWTHPPRHRDHWLVLLSAGAFFLLAYYFLFTHDGFSKRYILVPAILLFPWVGLGLERIRSSIAGCRWPRIAMVMFLLVFFGAPAYKSLEDFPGSAKGKAIRGAGQWLADQPDLEKAVIACSEPRVRFYTSEKLKFLKEMESSSLARNFSKMESVAFRGKADLLLIETSKDERHLIPQFKHYSLLKEFLGVKNDVLVYSRKNKGPVSG